MPSTKTKSLHLKSNTKFLVESCIKEQFTNVSSLIMCDKAEVCQTAPERLHYQRDRGRGGAGDGSGG